MAAEDQAMTLRINSYAAEPDYDFDLEYMRDGVWSSMKDRVITDEPITVEHNYRQLAIASVILNNEDGLLTIENTDSAYNKNEADEYDPLLDGARLVRLKQGINCCTLASDGCSFSSSVAPTSGTLNDLGDNVSGDPTNPADAAWVRWGAVAANAELVITVDLGSQIVIRHGAINFMSKTSASAQIMLPSTVQFAYSVDGSSWTNIGPAFDMGEYSDAIRGQQFLAWFTDCNRTGRYVRATIKNINEENEIYADEFVVYAGDSTAWRYATTFTGYLGDEITDNALTGEIVIKWQDCRKRETDNRLTELTPVYENQRAEQIIYDLLTNPIYWSGSGMVSESLVKNGDLAQYTGGWPSYSTVSWTLSSNRVALSQTYARTAPFALACGYAGAEYAEQTITLEGGATYLINYWHGGQSTQHGTYVTITPNVGPVTRYPETGRVAFDANGKYSAVQFEYIAPEGATSATFRITFDSAINRWAYIDDITMVRVDTSPGYTAALTPDEIGWSASDNLSAFLITKWQGQQGTILDYCNEIAGLIGWVYDADENGIRQFWEPEYYRTVAHPYLNFFGIRRGDDPVQRTKSDADVRNVVKIIGYEDGNKEVPRTYRHAASIARYGARYGRITEPLVKTAEASDYLGKALLRDFAFAGRGLTANLRGDFDMDRPCRVFTVHEMVRAFMSKAELWSGRQFRTEMTCAGKGDYRLAITGKKYESSQPATVSGVTLTAGTGQIAVAWDVGSEIDIDGYHVYWAAGDTPVDWQFTKRNKVSGASDTITGLVNNGGVYWVYVTAVNLGGSESEPSAIVRCVTGSGNTGSETLSWGIGGLAASITDNDPNADLDLSWTPDIFINPDYVEVNLYGPSTDTPPANLTQYARMSPIDGEELHFYASFIKEFFGSGNTLYFRLAITEVVIRDTHYRFGSPLLSDVVSVAWP